ncbi:MAG: nucleotidyltransferase domain-containing protein [Thermoanaerobacteraceae bacterium]|nr:nucleotidyltransferase domain-containing protein [Thermoanaerobacteraceae bacterium]
MSKEKRLLTDAQKRKIKSILRRELSRRREIVFAYLHGSFLLPVPCGDVDVAVYLEEAALSPKHWEYEAALAMSLDHLVGMPVDVLTLNHAPVALRYHASRGRVLCSRNELARFTFLEETWREYFDYQPVFRAFLKDLLE